MVVDVASGPADAGSEAPRHSRFGLGKRPLAVSVLMIVIVAFMVVFAVMTLVPPLPDMPVALAALLSVGISVISVALALLRAILVRARRVAWALLALAGGCVTFASMYAGIASQGGTVEVPVPSPADVGILLVYPFAVAGIVALIHDVLRSIRLMVILDGTIAGVGAAAVYTAIALGLVDTSAQNSATVAALRVAYPTGSAVIIGTLLCLYTITGWRRRANVGLLTAGFAIYAVANAYLTIVNSGASHSLDDLVGVAFLLAATLIGLGAWQSERTVRVPDAAAGPQRLSLAMLVLPSVFALASLTLLLVATRVTVSMVAIVLAGFTLVAVVVRAVMSFREVQRVQDEVAVKSRELEYLALHDILTGLANRALFYDRVEQALARSRRSGSPVAAMYLDLDGFKAVNDTHGHGIGDLLLREVAARLTGAVRATDTVGRLGGDEFVVLLEGESLAAGPEIVAQRIMEVLAPPYALGPDGVSVRSSASIGIAVGARASADDLLRDADVALYQAKGLGKDRYVMFGASR